MVGVFRRTAGGRHAGDDKRNRPARHRTANHGGVVGLDAGIYAPDPSGAVLFGWADQGVPGLVTCPAAAPDCQESFMPDGCYDLPNAIYGDPIGNPASIGPISTRLNIAGALFVAFECAGATADGICASGEGCIVDADCATAPCTSTADVVCLTQDAGLISFPIN